MATSASRLREAAGGGALLVAAFFGVFAGFGSLFVFTFGLFLKPLGNEFGWSREAVSGAFGAAAISVAVCSPLLGRLLDRYGPRRVILPCMAVFGLAIASLALLKGSLAQFYVVAIAAGIVGNGTTQLGYSRAVTTWFDRRRGMALAVVMAGSGVGSIVLPPAAQALISGWGWRAAYVALGAVVLVCGIPLTAMFVRERPVPVEARKEHSAGAGGALKSRVFWTLVAVLFLSSISVNGAITHMAALLTDRGVSARAAAEALSLLGGASLLGRFVTGWLLDRFFGPWVAFGMFAGTAAGIYVLAGATGAAGGMAAAALIGLGLGAEADITPYLLTRYFALDSFSTIYGFTWSAYAVAGALGPVVLGRGYDLTGSYATLVAALAGAAALAALLVLALPRYPAVGVTEGAGLTSPEPA